MNELYDGLAAELDSLHVRKIFEDREWRSTGLVYIFIVDFPYDATSKQCY
jgi:hypothetical protein